MPKQRMRTDKAIVYISSMDNPKMTLRQWHETIEELMERYGANSTFYFDAGHNDVTAYITPKPDYVVCSECKTEFKNYEKLGEHIDITGHITFA